MQKGIKITIPASFRKNLSKNMVIARGIDGCLFLYSDKNWRMAKTGLEKLANEDSSKDTLRFVNLFLSGAEKIKMSKDGNTIIPFHLADYANINKDVVLIEIGMRLSIWSKEEFRKYKDKAKNKISKNILKHISLW